ncbi:MAG: VWA domain-containing protein [Anaerolineae bacterium]
MNFLTPTAFALAALLPVVIAMYFLKLRREDHPVSSIYLWQRLVRDYEANAPWQRLRRNLLLLLQLLFLIALILALARPFLPTEGAAGQSLILIVDISASMAATDVQPSRLDVARARAKDLIASLPDNARVTVIAAGHIPEVLVSSAQDRRQARDAIDSLRIENGRSDLATALTLAGAVAARQTQAEIIILSDGRVDLEPTEVPAAVRYIPVGEHGDNQAVSALSLRELAAGQAVSLFAQVTNHARERVSRRLDIYVDGQLFDAREITIPAGDAAEIVQDDLPATTQQVEVRLEGVDGLAIDDRAWAVHTAGEPAPVLLVSEGNLFLETALSLLPTVELTVIDPGDYNSQPQNVEPEYETRNTQYAIRNTQLTIFDQTVPVNLPATNAFFIAPPAPTAWFTPTGTIRNSQFTIDNLQLTIRNDPLMRYVDLTGLQVLEASAIPLPDWARPLITTADQLLSRGAEEPFDSAQDRQRSGDDFTSAPFDRLRASSPHPRTPAPLLFAGDVAGRRVAVLAFDLRNSDLVLRPAFPLLMSNLIDFLVPGARGLVPAQIRAGEPVVLTVPPEVADITLTYPDGRLITLTPERGRLTFADTNDLGVYQIALRSQDEIVEQTAFAVNLFSPEESAITPRATLPIAGAVASQAGATTQAQGRRELWRPLALVALTLLLIEWLIYQRVTLTQLWSRGLEIRDWRLGN